MERQQQRAHSERITRRQLGARHAGHCHTVGGFQDPARDDDVHNLDAGKVEQRAVRQQGDDDLAGRISKDHERQDGQTEEEGRIGADGRRPAEYVDEGDEHDRYDLGIPGSLKDIEPLAGKLSDGLHVILYEDGSLEVEAILEFEPKYNIWMARPLWETLRRFEVEEETPPAAAK